jgi:hypothetical protein
MGLMCLGYVSVYGGQSDSASNTAQAMAGNHDDSQWAAQVSLSGGFGESDLIALFSLILQFYMCSAPGFGAFVFFVAFATFITAAVYISPMYCGSQNEKRSLCVLLWLLACSDLAVLSFDGLAGKFLSGIIREGTTTLLLCVVRFNVP